jgi:hypothetical protein
MMKITMNKSNICEQFNNLEWHDSKLRTFAVVRENDRDDVIFQLELRGMPDAELKSTNLRLIDATYLRTDIDLGGKYQCADDISSASCQINSELREELLASQFRYTPDALDGFYHFDFYLIPPGGRIHVFAKDFELRFVSET